MRIYLAGPMTGIPCFNFPAFDAAEADLIDRGYDVVAPADLHDPEIRPVCMASPDGALNSVASTITWGEALALDVKMIADDGIEAIVVMRGWEKSRGARLEVFVGRLCGLPIYEYGFSDPLKPVAQEALRGVLGGVA